MEVRGNGRKVRARGGGSKLCIVGGTAFIVFKTVCGVFCFVFKEKLAIADHDQSVHLYMRKERLMKFHDTSVK